MASTTGSSAPVLTPDGSRAFFAVEGKMSATLFVKDLRSSGAVEKLDESCIPWGVSADGQRVLCQRFAGNTRAIDLIDRTRGARRLLLAHPAYSLYQAQFSPDGRSVAFAAVTDADHARLYVAPLRADGPIPVDDWIPVTDGSSWDDKPRWAPSGDLLHFVSRRDGHLCFWAQRLDPATRRPSGEPFAVSHFHGARSVLPPVGLLDTSVTRGEIVFNLAELSGNIWMTRLEP